MNTRVLAGDAAVTDLTRKVGSLHLAVAGLVNVLTGVALGVLLVSGEFVSLLVATLPSVVDEVALVANAPLILWVAARGAPVASVALALVGVVQFSAGWYAYRARRWSRGIGAALLGSVNPVTLPLGLVAVILLSLSRAQFADANGAAGE